MDNNNEMNEVETTQAPIRGLYYLTERNSGRKKKVVAGIVTNSWHGRGVNEAIVTNVEMNISDYNSETKRREERKIVVAFWNNNGAALSDWARELKIGTSITVVIDDKEDGSVPRVDRLIRRNGYAPLDNGEYNIVVGYVSAPKVMTTKSNQEYVHIGVQTPNEDWHNVAFFKKSIDEKVYNSIIKRLEPKTDENGTRKFVKVAFLCGKQSQYTDRNGVTAYSYVGFQYEVLPDDVNMTGNKNAETPNPKPRAASNTNSVSETKTATQAPVSTPQETAKVEAPKSSTVPSVNSELGNTVINIGIFRNNPTSLANIIASGDEKNIKWLNFVATQMPVAPENVEMSKLKDNIKTYLEDVGLIA